MNRLKTFSFQKTKLLGYLYICALLFLCIRVAYLMVFRASHYAELAVEVEQRERHIKAARGRIIDRNGTILASNKTVCTISVIHSQIEDEDKVIACLSQQLDLPKEEVAGKVKKNSSIEKIKSNVSKEIGDAIREYELAGVKVDDDYKRYYPYDSLQSKVIGFTGGDNQGIIGIESYYDSYLQGTDGKILTYTDAKGVELPELGEVRLEPEAGKDLYVSLDYNICKYATQLAYQTMEKHQIDYLRLFVMTMKSLRNRKAKELESGIFLLNNYAGDYIVSLYAGIWRKDFMEKTLTKTLNAWQYEVALTNMARQLNARCADSRRGEFPILDVIRKGKVLTKARKYFDENPIYSGNREDMKAKDEWMIEFRTWLREWLPKPLFNISKAIMRRRGYTFFSDKQ